MKYNQSLILWFIRAVLLASAMRNNRHICFVRRFILYEYQLIYCMVRCGVMVNTSDFNSGNPGSNLDRTPIIFTLFIQLLKYKWGDCNWYLYIYIYYLFYFILFTEQNQDTEQRNRKCNKYLYKKHGTSLFYNKTW